MSKKERLEDLGRLREKLESMHGMLNFYSGRSKDFPDWVSSKSPEERDDFLYQLICLVRKVDDILADCIVIACGDEDF